MNASAQKKITLSVFMPFYNEEANISRAVETAVTVLRDIPQLSAYEVIIVDDGSRDATPVIAQELLERFPDIVRVVTHERNHGYGAAVNSGFKHARHEYVFFTDGDLQFDLREIARLLEWVSTHRVVIGYRSSRADPFHRKMNAWAWNRLVTTMFGFDATDIDCAFKLFETRLVSDLDLRSKGAMISTELLYLLARGDIEVKEVPVTHLPRLEGKTSGASPKVVLKAFSELAGLYFTTR